MSQYLYAVKWECFVAGYNSEASIVVIVNTGNVKCSRRFIVETARRKAMKQIRAKKTIECIGPHTHFTDDGDKNYLNEKIPGGGGWNEAVRPEEISRTEYLRRIIWDNTLYNQCRYAWPTEKWSRPTVTRIQDAVFIHSALEG